MSRVVYANTVSTPEQEALRATHGVRLIEESLEGTGVNAVSNGTYGFTYSPALQSAPLFCQRRFRSYETHKLQDGSVVIVGFGSAEDAAVLKAGGGEVRLQPEPEEGADVLLVIPYSRIKQHHQFAIPAEHGIRLHIS